MLIPAINWANLYPGVDHAMGSNGDYHVPSSKVRNVNLLRVDLTAANIRFLATPQAELAPQGLKTTDFLQKNFDAKSMRAMLAVNANFFYMSQRNEAHGLVVSQGRTVMPYGADFSPYALLLTQANEVALVSTEEEYQLAAKDIQTAVAGRVNFALGQHATNPTPTWSPLTAARTAIGFSAPSPAGSVGAQYLYLLTIDGLDNYPPGNKSPDYYGATLSDVADWMTAAGAHTAICLDGGGSTTMARIDDALPDGPAPTAQLMSCPHDDEKSTCIEERLVAIAFAVIVGK